MVAFKFQLNSADGALGMLELQMIFYILLSFVLFVMVWRKMQEPEMKQYA
jgi:membrane protein implicated in regulation of membrane protease activity